MKSTRHRIVGVPPPFFPGILLSSNPPEPPPGKRLVFRKDRLKRMEKEPTPFSPPVNLRPPPPGPGDSAPCGPQSGEPRPGTSAWLRGVWRFGGLEVWRFGGLEVWRFGGLEVWRCLEVWRFQTAQQTKSGPHGSNPRNPTRSSSREVRIKIPFYSSRGTLPKKRGKRALLRDLAKMGSNPNQNRTWLLTRSTGNDRGSRRLAATHICAFRIQTNLLGDNEEAKRAKSVGRFTS